MTSNQAKFVKSGVCQKRLESRERLIFKGISFDTVPAKSSAGYSHDWSITRA
jgi:hypothetical protein